MKTYLLCEPFSLRGWDGLPFGVRNEATAATEFFSRDTYELLLKSDGQTEIDPDALKETQKKMLDAFLRKGTLKEAAPGEGLRDWQKYVNYPAAYKRDVQWSITGGCNYRCRHCFMSAPDAKFAEPSREDLLDIVDQMEVCGISSVSLTGGEPLISPYLFDVIRALKQRDMKLSVLYTNGALVTEKLLDRLDEIGVHPVFQLSYDGLGWHDWMRGVPGAEKAALDALRLLKKRGYDTGVSMALHRHNIGVVNDSIRLLKDLGVSHIKMNVASPTGLWAKETEHFISQDEVNQLLYDSIIPKYFEDGAGVGIQFCLMMENDPARKECRITAAKFGGMKTSEEDFACGAVKNSLYISPEGYVLPCMPLTGTAIESEFENLHQTPLREILTCSHYRDMGRLRMKEVIGHNTACHDCKYRLLCGGGCRACACGDYGTDFLGIDQEVCNFFQHGWYEKAKELCERYAPGQNAAKPDSP